MNNFLNDESGAVTVDWVVLTAALVGLGLAVMAVVSNGVENQADAMDEQLSDGSIIRVAFTGNAEAAFGAACSAFGGGCDASLGDLSSLSNPEFAAVQAGGTIDNTTALGTSFTGAGLTQDGDGNWGQTVQVDDGTGTGNTVDQFNINTGATDQFNAAAAYDAAANGAIAAEAAARAN